MTLPELTCAFCEHKGHDVTSRIVEVEPQRNVTVYSGDRQVPERFRVAARCLDREACDERRYGETVA